MYTQQHEPLYQHYCLLLSTNPPKQTVGEGPAHSLKTAKPHYTFAPPTSADPQQVSFCAPGKEVILSS